MKTDLHPRYQNTTLGAEAETILRSCVHCGFCNATCPTYQELSDERDGPRGRIYLIKQILETDQATARTELHLDRCLTCRACEATCPSGVEYGRLLDIGRGVIATKTKRKLRERCFRWCLKQVLPRRTLMVWLVRLARWLQPLMPAALQRKIPAGQKPGVLPVKQHSRRMLLLQGCVQAAATPNTNAAARRVLDRLGITLLEIREVGCCGAVGYHLADHGDGKYWMRRNIDAWWPLVEQGVEAIVVAASGCGAMLQDYGRIFRDDPNYAEKAAGISHLIKDLSCVIGAENLHGLALDTSKKLAVHCPCSLQHAMGEVESLEKLLKRAGFDLARVAEKHLCCGSAGTYSLLQPTMSQTLLDRKVQALTQDTPDLIVTANIGCQLHLASGTEVPVLHWIELLDQTSH